MSWFRVPQETDEALVHRFLLASLEADVGQRLDVLAGEAELVTFSCERCNVSFDLAVPPEHVRIVSVGWIHRSSHRRHWPRVRVKEYR